MDESLSKKRRKTKFKEITQDLSKEELVRRLKSVSQELTSVEQGESLTDLEALAASLATYFIFYHNDKDVKSFAACCLADILRIFTPEPPYNEEQLKDIFRLFLQQFVELGSVKEGPAYQRHFYILETLALGNTFAVCIELEAMDIIQKLFETFFTVVSNHHNIRVKNFMLDIMCPLVLEGDSLPQEIFDLILTSLIEPNKSKKSEAYQLACDLIDRCSSALEPYVQLFFNNTLVLGPSPGSQMSGKLYDLLYELYKINKNVLLYVLPQLDFKLQGSDESERLEAVKLLRRLFEYDGAYLSENNKTLWKSYLGRFVDVSLDIRVECIQMSKQFLLSSTEKYVADVTEQLLQRILDPDEKVRSETVVIICEAAGENFSLIQSQLIDAVKGRTRDKKWLVRREAITSLGKLYKIVYSSKNVQCKKDLSWVPSSILHLYVQDSIEDRLCIERVFHGCLIPVSLDAESRMKRLLTIYLSLDETSMNMFDSMMKHRARVSSEFSALLELFKSEEEDSKEKKLHSKIVALARCLPDPVRTQDHLKKLLQICNDDNLYQLFTLCVDFKQECPKKMKSVTEILKKLTSKSAIIDTVKGLLDRICSLIVDMPSFTILLKEIKLLIDGINNDNDPDKEDSEEVLLGKGKNGLKLVKCIASTQPAVFQSKQCYEFLLLFIKHNDSKVVELTLEALNYVIAELEAVDKTLCSCYQPVLSKLVIQGLCRQAKLSLRCLDTMLNDPSIVMERIFKNLLEKLNFDVDSSQLQTVLSALGEIAILAPTIFEIKQKIVINDFIVKQLLITDREDTSNSQESDDEWQSDSLVSQETLSKIKGIKLLTNWLLGLRHNHSSQAIPVFRLLSAILVNEGDLTGNKKISAANRSRLRLAAGLAILKIVQNVNYVDVITLQQYQQLSFVIQDSCYKVREKFTTKLHQALDKMQLPLDYLAFFSLAATDPSKERRLKVYHMISRNAQTRREYSRLHSVAAARPYNVLPEYCLPYVVHLLAHHPDFNPTDMNALQKTKKYLWFFLEPIMGLKAENYSFLKKLLENIKQTKDNQEPDNNLVNEKLYTVCDLAIHCIMTKCHTFTLKDFPGNLVLPKKLFIADKNLNNTKLYLPKDFVLSPKKNKTMLDADTKVVPNKIKQEKFEEQTTKRSLATYSKRAALDSETENRTPNKKSRFIPKDKELKTPVEISQRAKNAKSIVRNLEKNKALSPSPQKRSPLKSPKMNIRDTPNSNSSVTLSDTDIPKTKSAKQAQLKKTQSKLDSFIQIKKGVNNDNESTDNKDVEKEKRKQNKFGRQDKRLLSNLKNYPLRSSPLKTTNVRISTSKRFETSEIDKEVAEEMPHLLSNNDDSTKTSEKIIPVDKAGKLLVKRKQRARR